MNLPFQVRLFQLYSIDQALFASYFYEHLFLHWNFPDYSCLTCGIIYRLNFQNVNLYLCLSQVTHLYKRKSFQREKYFNKRTIYSSSYKVNKEQAIMHDAAENMKKSFSDLRNTQLNKHKLDQELTLQQKTAENNQEAEKFHTPMKKVSFSEETQKKSCIQKIISEKQKQTLRNSRLSRNQSDQSQFVSFEDGNTYFEESYEQVQIHGSSQLSKRNSPFQEKDMEVQEVSTRRENNYSSSQGYFGMAQINFCEKNESFMQRSTSDIRRNTSQEQIEYQKEERLKYIGSLASLGRSLLEMKQLHRSLTYEVQQQLFNYEQWFVQFRQFIIATLENFIFQHYQTLIQAKQQEIRKRLLSKLEEDFCERLAEQREQLSAIYLQKEEKLKNIHLEELQSLKLKLSKEQVQRHQCIEVMDNLTMINRPGNQEHSDNLTSFLNDLSFQNESLCHELQLQKEYNQLLDRQKNDYKNKCQQLEQIEFKYNELSENHQKILEQLHEVNQKYFDLQQMYQKEIENHEKDKLSVLEKLEQQLEQRHFHNTVLLRQQYQTAIQQLEQVLLELKKQSSQKQINSREQIFVQTEFLIYTTQDLQALQQEKRQLLKEITFLKEQFKFLQQKNRQMQDKQQQYIRKIQRLSYDIEKKSEKATDLVSQNQKIKITLQHNAEQNIKLTQNLSQLSNLLRSKQQELQQTKLHFLVNPKQKQQFSPCGNFKHQIPILNSQQSFAEHSKSKHFPNKTKNHNDSYQSSETSFIQAFINSKPCSQVQRKSSLHASQNEFWSPRQSQKSSKIREYSYLGQNSLISKGLNNQESVNRILQKLRFKKSRVSIRTPDQYFGQGSMVQRSPVVKNSILHSISPTQPTSPTSGSYMPGKKAQNDKDKRMKQISVKLQKLRSDIRSEISQMKK